MPVSVSHSLAMLPEGRNASVPFRLCRLPINSFSADLCVPAEPGRGQTGRAACPARPECERAEWARVRLGQPSVTAAPAPARHGRSLSAALSALKIPRKALLGAAPRPRQRPGCFPAFVGAFTHRVCFWSLHAHLLGAAALLGCLSRRAGLGQGLLGTILSLGEGLSWHICCLV